MKDKVDISRYYGLSIIANLCLEKSSEIFKSNNEFFSHVTKKHLSNFIFTSKPMWDKIKNLKELNVDKDVIKTTSENLGYELETEIIQDELTVQVQIVEMLIDLLLKADVNELYDLHLFLKNKIEKNNLYTEEEVLIILKKLGKTLNPVISYNDQYFKEYLK